MMIHSVDLHCICNVSVMWIGVFENSLNIGAQPRLVIFQYFCGLGYALCFLLSTYLLQPSMLSNLTGGKCAESAAN